jgi:hypothetical protein
VHNLFWWLGGACAILTVVALYLQFLIGDNDKVIRDRLADWYVYIADGDWSRLFVYSAGTTERFLSYLFGSRLLSLRYFLTASAIALIVNVVVFSRIGEYSLHDVEVAPVLFGASVGANVLIDVTALALSRLYFRKIAKRQHPRVVLDLVVIFGIGYLAVGAAYGMLLLVGLSHGDIGSAGLTKFDIAGLFLMCLLWPGVIVADVSQAPQYWTFWMPGPAAFSAILLFAAYFVTVLVYFTRPIIQKPLSTTLEHLASVKTGVLPTVLGGLAAVSALLGYFKK